MLHKTVIDLCISYVLTTFNRDDDDVRTMANLDASENVSQFGTDERAASVRSVHVQPHCLAVTDKSDLFQVVERADGRSAECRTHLQCQSHTGRQEC